MTTLAQQLDEIEKAIEEEQVLIDNYNSLLDNSGYKTLCTIMTEQVRLRRTHVFSCPAHGLDGLIARDKDIAELQGINTAMAMPQTLLADCEMNINALREQYQEVYEELQSQSDDNTNLDDIGAAP